MLLVYIVGRYSPDEINIFPRTKDDYRSEDYRVIQFYADRSKDKKIVTTPYIISEVVHFLENEQNRPKHGRTGNENKYFQKMIDVLSVIVEHYENGNLQKIIENYSKEWLIRFGIPDLSLVNAVDVGYAFLSSDRDLCDRLFANKKPALHFARAKRYYLDNLVKS